MSWLDRLICGFTGHRTLFYTYAPDRLSVTCVECGYESHGIAIGPERQSKPAWKNLSIVRGQARRDAA